MTAVTAVHKHDADQDNHRSPQDSAEQSQPRVGCEASLQPAWTRARSSGVTAFRVAVRLLGPGGTERVAGAGTDGQGQGLSLFSCPRRAPGGGREAVEGRATRLQCGFTAAFHLDGEEAAGRPHAAPWHGCCPGALGLGMLPSPRPQPLKCSHATPEVRGEQPDHIAAVV